MGDFFHGWRRKVGCVTLVMACALAGMWVRSLFVGDFFGVTLRQVAVDFQSFGGQLIVNWAENTGEPAFWWNSIHDRIERVSLSDRFGSDYQVKVKWCGIELSEAVLRSWGDEPTPIVFLILPYWSVVVPLTLLSALLILWKPRRVPKQAPIAIVESGLEGESRG